MADVYLFDLDGTLVDRLPSVKAFLPEQFARYCTTGAPLADAFVARFLSLDRGGYASKHEVYRVLAPEFRLSASVPELVDDFRANAFKTCSAQRGAETILKRLQARGVELGVVTNGSKVAQEQKLAASGLAPYFGASLISETLQIRKPEPAIFREAACRFDAEPSACVFVGDHPEKDIVGAQQVGMSTVWLHHGRTWPKYLSIPPTFTISALEELLSLTFTK